VTTFKVKGQGHQAAHRRVGTSGSCSNGLQNVLAVRNCCYVAAVCSATRGVSAPTGEEESGGCISWRLPAYSLFILTASMGRIIFGANRLWGESSVGQDVHGVKRPWGEMSMGRNVLPWGEVSMGRNVRGAKSPHTVAYMWPKVSSTAFLIASTWSVFHEPVRTNNDVEGWHYRLNVKANHGRLNLYPLIQLLHAESQLVDASA